MIQHLVLLNLKYQDTPLKEQVFFNHLKELASIPEVNNLKVSKQVSYKNPFQNAISMNFENKASYQRYLINVHHDSFVENYWKKDVAEFMEVDLSPLDSE
jgi:hypothetical protein